MKANPIPLDDFRVGPRAWQVRRRRGYAVAPLEDECPRTGLPAALHQQAAMGGRYYERH